MLTGFQIFIAICFCVNATLAINFTIRFFMAKKPKLATNRFIVSILLSSALWSFGMGLMSLQSDDHWAYIWRTIGIFGTFMFMICMQRMICTISTLSLKTQRILNIISELGIVVYFLYITPGQTIFVHNAIGTTFYFKPGIINIIYTLYYVLISTNIFVTTINISKKHPIKQVKAVGKRFIIVELLIFFGATFDLIMPAFGIVAFPGSGLTHFWGVIVFWFAVKEMYNSEITVTNMSSYIYYFLDTPVMIYNSKGKLELANDATFRYFSLDQTVFEPGALDADLILDTESNFFEFESQSQLIKARAKSSNAPCDVAISKITNKYEDIIGFIVLVNDLTDHETVIKKLEQAKLAADSANMAKSLFLANMSHEIRTPLNAILGFSQLALTHNDLDPEILDYFTEISQAGELLLSIINEILDISKIELGKLELHQSTYKPARIFKDVELITRVAANKKKLDLNISIDPQIPEELSGDKDKVREILINLLNNSVKYTSSGHIDFSAKVVENTGYIVTLEFKVSDTGIGIKKEDLPTIFDKFKRLDDSLNSMTEGTGLGLSIVKGLVDLMHGEISVESVEGLGSVFTVRLTQRVVNNAPITLIDDEIKDDSSIDSENKSNSSAETSSANATDITRFLSPQELKVLVVDDNFVNLKVTSMFLKNHGIMSDLAKSGEEAIQMCTDKSYDLVFMDHMMPKMDGVEAMKNIRKISGYEKGSAQKIIALTANEVAGVEEKLLAEGFDAFIGKPMDFDKFINTIQKLLSKKKYNTIY